MGSFTPVSSPSMDRHVKDCFYKDSFQLRIEEAQDAGATYSR